MYQQSVVSFGAGCVGRGFLGQLFSESGYAITFVEIDDPLIAALNARRGYTLRLVEGEWREELTIPVEKTLHSFKEPDDVVQAILSASLVTTSVGTRSLPDIAPLIAAGIVRRAERAIAAPLNVMICENMQDASATFQGMVAGHIPTVHRAYFESHSGLVDVVIGRTIPRPTVDMRAHDCSLIIADGYKELPVNRPRFVGPLPNIVGLKPVDNFKAYIDRKLYLHNCGHAIMGYLGYLRGHTFTYEAFEDANIYSVVERAFAEAKAGLHGTHGIPEAELDEHITLLLPRLANRALPDTLIRLGRDPLRKLSPKDRLVGAARLAEKVGVSPEALSWGIAAGYLFDYAEDSLAVALQRRLADEGLDIVMADVSGIAKDEPLGRLVVDRYTRLKTGEIVWI
jgi:mannitol-1-phosphate 5-dehydrogenase